MTKATSGFSWPQIHGLLGNAIYGGRVDNKLDQQKLQVYLNHCFTDETLSAAGKISLKKLIPNLGKDVNARATYYDFL